MRATPATLVAVLAGLGLVHLPAHATHPAAQFVVPMNGFNEVTESGVSGQGDLDAIGLATLGLDDDSPGHLTYTVEYQNVSGRFISGLHIHGPGTTLLSNGPIFIDLPVVSGNPNDSLPNGTIAATITEEQFPGLTGRMTQIRNNPSEFYINLHTVLHQPPHRRRARQFPQRRDPRTTPGARRPVVRRRGRIVSAPAPHSDRSARDA